MNTNNIKSFAKEARLLLLEGVAQRLKFWGFKADGSNDQTMDTTEGGYIFRGNIYTDVETPKKWKALKNRIQSKEDIQDVVEEAAYTWFNRLMAIKILEMNGFINPQISYDAGAEVPAIVQQAKRGKHELQSSQDKALLLEYLQEDNEEQALGLLLTDLCHRNRVMHDVFGRIDDYTEILLPQDLLSSNGLLELINGDSIPVDDYKEVELIGWLYQFYISDKKDEVFAGFKKNKKARAQDIPAATQIFTPKWIVKYMVENTIGKSYLDYNENSDLKAGMKYLVESSEETTSPSLVDDINELTLIDPACGSGHILVTGFELLFEMYREEGYMASQAVEQILAHNIYGLDIDDRAMQLARFAVLLKAASYDRGVLDRGIVPHIYSYPEDIVSGYFSTKEYSDKSDWSELAGMKLNKEIRAEWIETKIDSKTKKEKHEPKKVTFSKGMTLNHAGIDTLYTYAKEYLQTDHSSELELFWGKPERGFAYASFFYSIQLLKNGKNLGSTLKLQISDETLIHLKVQYQKWQQLEQQASLGVFEQSIWNNLKPYLDVLIVLAKQYVAVVANPPYMGQKSMNADLKDYVNTQYPMTKADLFAVFMEVCLSLNIENGLMGMINQHSWMFLSSYEKLRAHLLENYSVLNMLHLGPRTFEELSGEVVQSTAFVLENGDNEKSGSYYRLVDYRNNIEKESNFLGRNNEFSNIPQTNFSKIPGSPIAYWVSEKEQDSYMSGSYLSSVSYPKKGIDTGENGRFLRLWSEIDIATTSFSTSSTLNKWYPYNKGGGFRKWYGNREFLVEWDNNGKEIKSRLSWKSKKPTIRNEQYHLREGFSWSTISSSGFSLRYAPEGCMFDNGGCTLFADQNLNYFAGLLNSNVAKRYLEFLSPTLNFQPGDIGRVLYDFSEENNANIDTLVSACVDSSKKDWDSFETSWDFEQSPLLNGSSDLESAFITWAQSVKEDFFQLHANEEELNRIFIDIYGLQVELTPEVALKDITILQDELDRGALENLEPTFRASGKEAVELPIYKDEVLSQFISYCFGLFLGRYRLDKKGLNIAHPNPSEEELAAYTYNGQTIEIDEDATIPLMGEDCAFPDDALGRLKDTILAIWGEDSLTENINFLQECLGMDLHKWLTTKFWGYHTSMYKKKPIYWLFTSNPKKPQNASFRVLVYMHRMDKFTVQKIQRKYLHPHQEFIKHEIERLSVNEANLSKQEIKKLEQYRNWEIECRDYNEVLKELANQQIEIDLDDGVAVNYPKFEGAVAKI